MPDSAVSGSQSIPPFSLTMYPSKLDAMYTRTFVTRVVIISEL
ncbi:MAG: hypothetical protein OEM18_06455 [Nitrosopumilus sp.]|nr:hypothetical protein [Nitrosopumilus sp.]MDH3502432.1 hypothetical protein [Nitrosopumilus sp.]